MTRFTKKQIVTMGALIGVGLLNPMSVAVLDDYFKLFYTGVFLVCSVWVAGYLLYAVLRPQPINIPKKNKKSTKPAFIAT